MILIEFFPPIKSSSRYEFRCIVSGKKTTFAELTHRVKSTARGYGSLFRSVFRFGFEAVNFEIPHNELWDSIYPLMWLIHMGGPLFRTEYSSAQIHFHYPIHKLIKDFYIKRAENFGFHIEVSGPEFDKSFDLSTYGSTLAFGGGKDSRMLYGALCEIGMDPVIYTAGKGNTPDIPEARISIPISGRMSDRVIAALMACPKTYYCGNALGEAKRETPWQQYYDWTSPRPLKEMSSFLQSIGLDTNLMSPVSVLPQNLIQKILYERYPDLYRHQVSVPPEAPTEKNLHVALLKRYHDIDFSDHCSLPLFKRLLAEFVARQTNDPDNFGYRQHREVINREMRSIIYHFKEDGDFTGVRSLVPDDWRGEWINYIHTYVYPEIDRDLLNIYKQYADDIELCPQGSNIFLVPV